MLLYFKFLTKKYNGYQYYYIQVETFQIKLKMIPPRLFQMMQTIFTSWHDKIDKKYYIQKNQLLDLKEGREL